MTRITLLTGPAAAGKNTISHVYAMQFCQRCAVIDTDLVRWMLRQPHLAPWPSDAPDSPARYQHRLGIRHSSMLAQSFVAEGYEVVICDVVGDALAAYYRELLIDHKFKIVLLLPTWEESLSRLRARSHSITEEEAQRLYLQQQELQNYDWKLDNTNVPNPEAARWMIEQWVSAGD